MYTFVIRREPVKIARYTKISWIDFENPMESDVTYLQENFDIHPLVIEEFVTPTFRPKATQYDNVLFLTVHIPLFDVEERTTYPGEIDIILTKTHLITGHKKKIFQLDQLFSQLQSSLGKRRLYMSKTPAHLLHHLLNILLETCFPRLEHVVKNIDAIERQIFRGNEREMVKEISVVKRDVLNFRRTLMPQRSILESLLLKESSIISKDLKPYFQDLIGTNIRLWNALESAKETITSLEETNNSLLSNKINEKMKLLTIFSVTLLPLTVYTGLLSINVEIPFGRFEGAFWIHLLISIFILLLVLFIFRVRKWI